MAAPWDANPGWSAGATTAETSDLVVYGAPGDGKVPAWNASAGRLEWATPSGGGGGASEQSGTDLLFTYATDITTGAITWSDPATSGTEFGSFDDDLQTFTFSDDVSVVLSLEMQMSFSADADGAVYFALDGTLPSSSAYLAQSNDGYKIAVQPQSGGAHIGPVWTTPPIKAAAGDTLQVLFQPSGLSAGTATNGAIALGIVKVN